MNLNVRKNPESKVNLTNNEILGLVSHQSTPLRIQ